jgi:hypothetical protein
MSRPHDEPASDHQHAPIIASGHSVREGAGSGDGLDALRKALEALVARGDPADAEIVELVRRARDDVEALLDERVRLRALVLDFLKTFEAPEEEWAALRRRARDEIAAG